MSREHPVFKLSQQSSCRNVMLLFLNLLQFLQFGWSHLETPQTIWFHQVILLRFGQDYDPDCKLMDDVLLAISDIVKAVL